MAAEVRDDDGEGLHGAGCPSSVEPERACYLHRVAAERRDADVLKHGSNACANRRPRERGSIDDDPLNVSRRVERDHDVADASWASILPTG